jgi:hypothetical protein
MNGCHPGAWRWKDRISEVLCPWVFPVVSIRRATNSRAAGMPKAADMTCILFAQGRLTDVKGTEDGNKAN